MTWLTWRQFRTQAITVYAAVVVLVFVVAGLRRVPGLPVPDPQATLGDVTEAQAVLYFVGTGAVALLPAVIGAFWGAPLVARELEAGTYRLAWSQSVTRTRWLVTKLLFIGATAMGAAALLSLAVSWWVGPIDRLAEVVADAGLPTRITPWLFDSRGVVSAGHAAFAFVLGVTVGVLVRRTLPAMAITLALLVAVQVAMPLWVRPHLVPPTDQTVAVGRSGGVGWMTGDVLTFTTVTPGGSWVLVDETLDPSGVPVEQVPAKVGGCALPDSAGKPSEKQAGQPAEQPSGQTGGQPSGPAGGTAAKDPVTACVTTLADLGYRQHVVYHAPDRFWALQWAETALFLLMSVILGGLCVRWTRHRLS